MAGATRQTGIFARVPEFRVGDLDNRQLIIQKLNELARQVAAAGTITLNDLSDLILQGHADNDLLQYDATSKRWVNRTFATSGLDARYVNVTGDTMTGTLYAGSPHANEDATGPLVISASIGVDATEDWITLANTANVAGATQRIAWKNRYGTGDFANGQLSGFIALERQSTSGIYDFVFGLTNSSSVEAAQVARLTSEGYFGIGDDASPDYWMDVNVPGGITQMARLQYRDGTDNPRFDWEFDTTNKVAQQRVTYSTGGYAQAFKTGSTEVMRLLPNGNILVGKTTDASNGKLQISGGSVRIEDNGSTVSPLFSVLSDDAAPWQIAAQNKTYSTNAGLGLRLFVDTSGNSSIYAADNGTSPGYLRFLTDETERARFTSSGQFIIGDPAESGAALFVDANSQPAIRIKADTVAMETAGALRLNAGYDNTGNESLLFQINGTEAARFAQATGNLLIGTTTDDGSNKLQVNGSLKAANIMFVDGANLTDRDLRFTTGASLRWVLRVNASSESGSDAGSNLQILARTDAGAAIDAPIEINRASAGSIRIGGTTNRNIRLLTGTESFGGGSNVIFICNAMTAPTTNPTGGGILYSEAGALKWRGSAGTVTTIANA